MKSTRIGISVFFVAILLLSTVLVPAVSGAADASFASGKEKQKEEIETLPEIEVIEATDTSSIVQVGDVLLSFKSNSEYTKAEMDITNLTTDEVTTVNYVVEEVNGKFQTNVFNNGESATVVMDYNPIEPGAFSKAFDIDNQGSTTNTKISLASTTKYVWDGVTFIKGSGIKYPHPDYDWYNYKGEVWESWKISGKKLNHYHVSSGTSATLLPLPAIVIGGTLGAIVGGGIGAVAGAALAQVLGGTSVAVLVDEKGCFWLWWAKDWGFYIVPGTPTLTYVPKYLRIGPSTLWNKISMTNP